MHPVGRGGSINQILTRNDLDRKGKNQERGWERGGKGEKCGSGQSLGHDIRWNNQYKRHLYRRQLNSGSISVRSWSQWDQAVGRWQDTQVRDHEKGMQWLVGGGSLGELGRLC